MGLFGQIATSLNLIRSQSPSWRTTAIDTALLEAIHQMEEASREQDQETQQASWEFVVISDLQVGASYEGLRGQDWPKHLRRLVSPLNISVMHPFRSSNLPGISMPMENPSLLV